MNIVEAKGMRMPAIGLGTWDLRGRDCVRLVQKAVELGYRHFDTAQMYDNEAEVGEGIRASGLKREDVFVTTKIHPENLRARDVETSFSESLARLKLGHVDLLLAHWPNKDVPVAETMDALSKVKKAGLAKNIGVSNFTIALIDEAVKHSPEPIACNQIEVHPYLDQEKILAHCAKLGIAVTAYSPIARGKLTEDGILAAIGKPYGKTAAQVSLRYLIQRGFGAIPRSSKVERLKENIDIFDFELSAAEMEKIGGLNRVGQRIVNVGWAPAWD